MSNITISTLRAQKAEGQRFSVVAAYDASFARLIDQAGIEVILVGDSLGMVLQGHDSTLPVSVDDMAYHTQCVAAASGRSLVIADMPFGSYNTLEDTLANATALMQAGGQMVKLEGGAWLCDSISALTERGIPVCAHLGLTPQSVNTLGGFKVQGRDEAGAQRILDDARRVEDAGAHLLVVECIPSELGTQLSQTLDIPVIGIGAGAGTDAQVLVVHDMLGISAHTPKFVRNFLSESADIQGALSLYHQSVVDGSFPGPEHSFS